MKMCNSFFVCETDCDEWSGVSEKQEIVVAGHLEDIVLVITTSFGEFGDYLRIKKIRETRLIIYERSQRRKMAFG